MRERQSTVSVIPNEGMCGSVCVCVRVHVKKETQQATAMLRCTHRWQGKKEKRERGWWLKYEYERFTGPKYSSSSGDSPKPSNAREGLSQDNY